MKIIQYLKSLVSSIKKQTLEEDARITAAELKLKTIPAYEEANKAFRSKKFASSEVQAIEASFRRFAPGNGNLVGMILPRLERVEDLMEICTGVVEKRFENTTLVDGITVLKLNVVKLLDSSAFISRYALHLLNFIYVHETAVTTGNPQYVGDNLNAGQIKWISDNLVPFAQLINAVAIDKQDVARIIDNIPDVAMGTDPEATVGMLGERGVNPMNILGFTTVSSNPIYHLRLLVAEAQANRYKEASELKQVLELRILNLAKANQNSPDAHLQKEILYTQSRVDAATAKMREYEESVK